MKITRRQLRILLEQEAEKAIKLSDKQNADMTQSANDALVKAGGAADDEIVQKAVKDATGIDLEDPSDLEGVSRLASGDLVKDDEVKAITETLIKRVIREELEKIGFYKKYSYGLDDIPNQTKAHDDIIGHT